MITVAETGEFIRKAKKLLSEDERQELVSYLSAHPEAGAIMEGTGEFGSYAGVVRVWGKVVVFV